MPQLISNDIDVSIDAGYKPTWREVTIVFRTPGGRVHALDGWQYGTLVVHATWTSPDHAPVTITHRPSKVAVARVDEVDEAVVKTEWLWDSCPRAWAGDDCNRSAIIGEVLEWLRGHQS